MADMTLTMTPAQAMAILQAQAQALAPYLLSLRAVPADSADFAAAVTAWKQNMLTYGAQVAALLADPNQTDAVKADATYYDGTWVMLQIKDYTGDASWQTAANNAHHWYRTYLDPNNEKIQGNWIFPHGLQLLGDMDTLKLLATNAAFADAPLSWSVSANVSREVAYNVMTDLIVQATGQAVIHLPEKAQQMFGHLDQWSLLLNGQPVPQILDNGNDVTPTYCRPFMGALTSYAMIELAGATPELLAPITAKLAAFWLLVWQKCFLAQQPVQNNPGFGLVDTLMYTNNNAATDGSGGMDPSPDLNLLIAPVLAWLYSQTHDLAWREKHDVLFIGGVKGAYLVPPKGFNQNYQRSIMGLKWRAM